MKIKKIEMEGIFEIVQNFSKEKVLEVNQIKEKGQVNDVYVLTTNSSRYVIRIDPIESTLDRFRKEKWCMDEASKQGVLGAKVLKIGIKNRQPYMLLNYLDGADGDEASKKEQTKIWAALGKYARKIHSLKVEGYGEKMAVDGIFDGSWKKFLDYNISSLNGDDKLLKFNIITPEQSRLLKGIFSELKNTKFNFGLVHHDLSLKNIRIDKNQKVYLLDWGSAEVNVIPHADIGEILHSSLKATSEDFEIFLKNYKLSKKEYVKIKPDIDKIRLLLCTDKLRWAIDKKPDLILRKTKEFRKAFELVRSKKHVEK